MSDLRQWSQTVMYKEESRILAKRYLLPPRHTVSEFFFFFFFTSSTFISDAGSLRTADLKIAILGDSLSLGQIRRVADSPNYKVQWEIGTLWPSSWAGVQTYRQDGHIA